MADFKKIFLVITLISTIIYGCSNNSPVELLTSLSQEDANSVALVLLDNGIINVTKQKAKDGTFTIIINKSDLTTALTVLDNNALPSMSYTNFGEVFKKDSFISTPQEEHGRFLYALNQEISNLIMHINGVLDVKVVVNVPQENDNLWQESIPKSSASVVITYQVGSRVDLYISRIKLLVSNSVPGLDEANVEVMIIPRKE